MVGKNIKVLISLISIFISLLCTCLSTNANDSCGSYDRYVLKFIHVYHVYFETNIDDIIEKYKRKYVTEENRLNKDKVVRKASSIIIDPENQEGIKLHLVSTTSNRNHLEKEVLRLAKSIRRSYGYEKDDKDFMDDKFLLGVKGAKYKNLQEDLLNYSSAINRFIRTRCIGDQFILSIENGKGILEYKPFNKEEQVELIKNADIRITKIDNYIQETERQIKELPIEMDEQKNMINQQDLTSEKANEAIKALENKFYASKKLMKEKLKTLKRKKKETEHYKRIIAENSAYQTTKNQRLVFENPQIIRRVISSYITKDRCLLDKMPDELLCILIGNIMSLI